MYILYWCKSSKGNSFNNRTTYRTCVRGLCQKGPSWNSFGCGCYEGFVMDEFYCIVINQRVCMYRNLQTVILENAPNIFSRNIWVYLQLSHWSKPSQSQFENFSRDIVPLKDFANYFAFAKICANKIEICLSMYSPQLFRHRVLALGKPTIFKCLN